MKIGILGATGQAGRAIAKWLVKTETADVVLIGRNRKKLDRLQQSLTPLSSHLPEVAEADAADRQSLETVFRDLDMAVIAVSSPQYLPVITDAAQNTGTDCMDTLLGSAQKNDFLASHRESFEKHGIIYITDGGYHPGVPAALIRCAETVCPGLHTAAVYGSFGIDWDKLDISFDTIVDFVHDICTMDMGILQDGNWVSDWHNMRKFDFRDGRGVKDCVPMGMEEIRELPQHIPSIRNAGFFIAGFGRITDGSSSPPPWSFSSCFPTRFLQRLIFSPGA